MKYKILAVDDNPINLKLLSRALVNSNYQILTADNGKKAFQTAVEVKPDLILLDVIMPDMDGFEVCKKLQERDETSHIPIVFITAKNDAVDKAHGLSIGAKDYLTKPFDTLEINARVRNLLKINEVTLKLARKNQELEAKLAETRMEDAGARGEQNTIQFLEKISKTGYKIGTENFELCTRVVTGREPVTSRLLPFEINNNYFAFIIVRGFKKDYPTYILSELLEQFANGFFIEYKNKEVSAKNLNTLLNAILDRFSPDIYDIAFTFSLGLLDIKKKNLLYYSMQQPLPLRIEKDGACSVAHGRSINFTSQYKHLIQAERIEFDSQSIFLFYQDGNNKTNKVEHLKKYITIFNKNNNNYFASIEHIAEKHDSSEKDRLIATLKIS